ncbi:MAG: thiamine-phosphate kinase [Blastocatellia bacterium]|nr:thiamine-phosphate kinase [Blastocatellia bacterium]
MPTESEIISRIRKRAAAPRDARVPIGDDAAVMEFAGADDLIACCDLMVEGVHFQTHWATPRLIGRKALAVTLSDVAAMGGSPRFAMISLALPAAKSSEFVNELFDGIFEMADAAGVFIIGGDTSSSPDSLFIDTIALGRCAKGRAITRAGALPGDRIFVTGSLGASRLGLMLLGQGFRLEDDSQNDKEAGRARRLALLKHLAPAPRLEFGRTIGEAGLANSMIDISDGLSTDLSHILEESRSGAIIHAAALPIDDSVIALAPDELKTDPLDLALHGGEEYELLFTAPPENRDRIIELSAATGLPVTEIGEIIIGEGLRIERNGALEPVKPRGYEHLI